MTSLWVWSIEKIFVLNEFGMNVVVITITQLVIETIVITTVCIRKKLYLLKFKLTASYCINLAAMNALN